MAVGTPAPAAEKVEVGLEVAGRSDLGGRGPFDDVAVVGRTAVVATGECPGGTLTVVDLKAPKKPSVVATVPLRAGTVAVDVDAGAIESETFTGDLVAVALTPCTGTISPSVAYFDVTVPASPRLLAERQGPGTGSIAVAQRVDGRVIAARPLGPATLAVDDITDPARPVAAGRWSVAGTPPGPCVRGDLSVAALHGDGRGALVVLPDGRVYDVDLSQPAAPRAEGEVATGARGRYGAVMPVGIRTLAVVADSGPDPTCPGAGRPRLRVLELSGLGRAVEVEPVQFTALAPPGRLVASGELAYVAWHGDGMRVVDLGAVKPAVTAQFIPEAADVASVALLDEHVVVVDRASGLYVLERPDEGGPDSTWWTNVVGLLPYLLFALMMTALLVLPRLALGYARARRGAPSPVPEPAGRRPA